MFGSVREDIKAVFDRDPAARNVLEVIFCYPGFHAIQLHRMAYWLWEHRLKFTARLVSHLNRFLTGIEIHPAARIGQGLFIDHGMGVVIGETAEIGNNVTLYHGVTLGGTRLRKEKRHPTLEDNVVVGAGATVLGPVTVGKFSRIGSGSVVVDNVPPNSTVVGVPGRVVVREGAPEYPFDLEHTKLPDPIVRAITCLFDQVRELEDKLKELENRERR